MSYTDAVVHEIQRFANILPLNLPHETTVDVTLKGYFIPKNTYIIPLLASVLRDQSQWEKPDVFYPEHFLDSEGKFVKKEAFMPFSAVTQPLQPLLGNSSLSWTTAVQTRFGMRKCFILCDSGLPTIVTATDNTEKPLNLLQENLTEADRNAQSDKRKHLPVYGLQ
ncbi:cytochrome P450 2D26-like isoform X3 [Alligator sinensis]|nr:cytochrome P450 2D26-like isoform X3 [Alligator sinensis]